jgi:hypothetical protein
MAAALRQAGRRAEAGPAVEGQAGTVSAVAHVKRLLGWPLRRALNPRVEIDRMGRGMPARS